MSPNPEELHLVGPSRGAFLSISLASTSWGPMVPWDQSAFRIELLCRVLFFSHT